MFRINSWNFFFVRFNQASDRLLPPARWDPTPRENLLESIRDYRKNKKLKQISPRVQAKCKLFLLGFLLLLVFTKKLYRRQRI